MKKIDEYIENIYKDFDKEDAETKILKEEMKSHLYDKANDLLKEGYSEEQSIQLAISSFGDESNVSNEMKSIIVKQTKYTNILFKLSLIILIIGFLSKAGGWYSERQYADKRHKNRQMVTSDIINSIKQTLSGRNELSEDDKKDFDKMLNDYNHNYNNGLYSVEILKNNVTYYEYNRTVSPDLIVNAHSGMIGTDNGWEIHRKQTDNDKYRESAVWNEMFNIKYASNSVHYRLNSLGFLLVSLSWVLMVVYYTQKAILSDRLSRNKIIIFSLETVAIFATYTTDKDIILPTTILFMLCNAIYPIVIRKSHKKRKIFS